MQSCSDSNCTGNYGIDISTNDDDVTVLWGTHLDVKESRGTSQRANGMLKCI